MIVFEFKLQGTKIQYQRIDEAIKITQFIRNKCLRYWMDNSKKTAYDLNKYTAVLAKEFSFANNLNSMARQAASERCWFAINRFFANCKAKKPGKKGYPKFQKHCRSVEYKTTGWKLTEDRKYIIFTDKCLIGKVKLIGTYDLHFYQIEQIPPLVPPLIRGVGGINVLTAITFSSVSMQKGISRANQPTGT